MAGLLIAALGLAGWRWLEAHPQHNPWAPLSLDDPPGWATARKLVKLRDDPAECRAVLKRSRIAYATLPAIGADECRRIDRTVVSDLQLKPAAAATCTVNAGLALWLRQGVQPAADNLLGSRVVALEHLGTGSCRRIGGGETGRWSEHATGNAIDLSGFVLADGRRIVVREHWDAADPRGRFLHRVRDEACGAFGTVLSPDYNLAHADHFHLDQAGSRRGWSYCR